MFTDRARHCAVVIKTNPSSADIGIKTNPFIYIVGMCVRALRRQDTQAREYADYFELNAPCALRFGA